MRYFRLLFSNLHRGEQGAMKQTIEAVCVGVALVGILFAAAVMFNGGVISHPAEASSTAVPKHLKDSPGSMINSIVNGDKVSDTITKDLNNLKGKLEADTSTGSAASENAGN
jgi:hypothetical protein